MPKVNKGKEWANYSLTLFDDKFLIKEVKALKIQDKVLDLAKPLAEDLGYQIVDVEYLKEGQNWFLRVYIDQAGGVSLDDCTQFSEQLSGLLDQQETNFIPQAYYLEVSSPGAERPLKTAEDLKQAVGSYIHVKLYEMIGPDNAFEGHLKEVDQDTITLTVKVKTRKKDVVINRDNISKARLAIEF